MRGCDIFLRHNMRGLSEVIVTLLLVMLAIVLVGVVFVVAHNLVQTGSQEAALQAKCIGSSLQVLSFSCTQTGSECNVTVKRTSGNDVFGGVRLVFMNANGEGNSSDSKGNFITPSTKGVTSYNLGVTNITQVSASIYFVDPSGKIQACPSSGANSVGSYGTSGTTSAGGGSAGGTTTNPPGDTVPVSSCTPPADGTLTSLCGSQQCGSVTNGTGTGCPTVICGNQNFLSNQGCALPYYCNSTYQCEAPKLVNSGTVTSVYPNYTVLYFGGNNLPRNTTTDQTFNDGKHYVRFPGSNEVDGSGNTNCTLIAFMQCLTPTLCNSTINAGSSFAQLSPSFPETYVNISIGDQYAIWNTKYGCMNASGTLPTS